MNRAARYDGTFVADYEFVEGAGDLDECNGRFWRHARFPRRDLCLFFDRRLAGHPPRLPRHPLPRL